MDVLDSMFEVCSSSRELFRYLCKAQVCTSPSHLLNITLWEEEAEYPERGYYQSHDYEDDPVLVYPLLPFLAIVGCGNLEGSDYYDEDEDGCSEEGSGLEREAWVGCEDDCQRRSLACRICDLLPAIRD